jgi:hypothetical protein
MAARGSCADAQRCTATSPLAARTLRDGSVLDDRRDAPSAAMSDHRHGNMLARRRISGMPPDGYRSTSQHRRDYFKV